jgi:uncharacterized protein with PIN domain
LILAGLRDPQASGFLLGMDLEPRTLETAGDRCEECGAPLTDREQELVLESGGPNLCSIHAAEAEPALAEDDALDV